MLEAPVIRWSCNEVHVHCPVVRCGKVHVHEYQSVDRSRPGVRVAACERVFSSAEARPDYELVFPGTGSHLTDGLTVKINGSRTHWHVVGYEEDATQHKKRTDSGYMEKTPVVPSHHKSHTGDATDQLSKALETFHISGESDCSFVKAKMRFDAACISGQPSKARTCLSAYSCHGSKLLNETLNSSTDNPILHTCCRLESSDMVEFLIAEGAQPDKVDLNRETAIQAALGVRQWKNLLTLITKCPVEAWGVQPAALATAMDELDCILGYNTSDIDTVTSILDRCGSAHLSLLEEVHSRSIHKVMRDPEAMAFDMNRYLYQINQDIYHEWMWSHHSGRWKTVAFLVWHPHSPRQNSLSGRTANLGGFLEQAVWYHRVLRLQELVKHNPAPSSYDGSGGRGSFNSSHAERQLLAYIIWNHTTELDTSAAAQRLEACAKGPLTCFRAVIYVSREPCADCRDFIRRVGKHFKLHYEIEGGFGQGVHRILLESAVTEPVWELASSTLVNSRLLQRG